MDALSDCDWRGQSTRGILNGAAERLHLSDGETAAKHYLSTGVCFKAWWGNNRSNSRNRGFKSNETLQRGRDKKLRAKLYKLDECCLHTNRLQSRGIMKSTLLLRCIQNSWRESWGVFSCALNLGGGGCDSAGKPVGGNFTCCIRLAALFMLGIAVQNSGRNVTFIYQYFYKKSAWDAWNSLLRN